MTFRFFFISLWHEKREDEDGKSIEKPMHIAIAGNIGSGKTTLTNMLARHYGWQVNTESVTENPYLDDYYHDIPRWSFALEVYFLKERFRDLMRISQSTGTIIQDRSIFEGVYVFTANNHAMGNLSDRDFETYMELFQQMLTLARLPELMIYLRASVPHLVHNIQKRGRDYEQQMPLDYLENLNRRYDEFIFEKYKGRLMVVDVDEMDFEHRPRDFAQIVDRVDAELFGLFPIEER